MFECEYCKTKFMKEENYTKHKCREETRLNEVATPRGKMAYKHYQTWFKKRKLLNPSHEIFVGSRYYNIFYTFTDYALKMGIPDVSLYIEYMSEESILPQHWYNDDIYKHFMNHFDKDCDAKTHLRITLTTLERLSTAFDCKISEVFSHLRPQDLIKLTQSRNLSPWVLLLSRKFRLYLENETNSEEQKLIESVINLSTWQLIFEVKKNSIKEVKGYLEQLDL